MLNSGELITIAKVLEKLKKSIVYYSIIILSALTLVFMINTFLEKPTYQTTTKVLINQSKESRGEEGYSETLKANIQLMNTILPVMTSSRTLKQVKENLHLNSSVSDIQRMLTISSDENSLVLNIVVQNKDSKKVVDIANELVTVAAKDVPTFFRNIELTQIEKADDSGQVSKNIRYVIAILVSTMICIVILVISLFYDTRIRSKAQIEELDVLFLGDIPRLADGDLGGNGSVW
ncbi:hypothetical protein HCJ39_11535 [Listeria rocourtiae]|uniref:YveK family protein n=1 Tax=Listeria rocourtiae TaxID=647910 RepID=UPI00162773EA|nr:Wzz/FepE/Etk N-terminal domain-containing protein [Listeria rocourtiae]MBC1605349.1 hypothetical protein [Listeria rocourtiae]